MDTDNVSRLTPALFLEAIPGSAGIKTLIAARAGCSRQTLDAWLQRHSELRDAYREECQSGVDRVESALLKRVDAGDTTAIIFYLKCKGRDRGFNEHLQIDQRSVVATVDSPTESSAQLAARCEALRLHLARQVGGGNIRAALSQMLVGKGAEPPAEENSERPGTGAGEGGPCNTTP